MKRLFIVIVIVLLAAGAGWILVKKKNSVVHYREIHPSRGPIAVEFRETGAVSPRNRLEIKPQIPGRIEDVLVVEGQKVRKGQIIAWMSSTERAAMLDAALSKGEAELKKWQDIYKPTPIIAPLNGFVIDRAKEPGQSVSTADVLLVMADNLIIDANIDETDLRYINLGQHVNFFLDAYPDHSFTGLVEHVAYESQVVNNVTVYEVKIKPLEVPASFRAGMTATIEVKAVPNQNALLLPYNVVQDKNGIKSVLIRDDAGQPTSKNIEVGVNNGKTVEIVSGINDNDTVLVQTGGAKSRKNSAQRMMGLPGMGGGGAAGGGRR